MAALTQATPRELREVDPFNPIVKSGSQIYRGSYVGLEHATGHLVPLDDAADRSRCGVAMESVLGNGAKTCGVIWLEHIENNCVIAGLTSQAQMLEPVYATTDNDLTLTRPADDAQIVGLVAGFVSAGVGHVFMLSALQSAILRLAGADKEEIILSTIPAEMIADGMIMTRTLYGHGKIVSVFCRCTNPVTTAAKTTTLTGKINATAITTGALTVTSAGQTPAGTEQAVTPSAANEFHDGDVLSLTAGTTTAFVEGDFEIGVKIQRLA